MLAAASPASAAPIINYVTDVDGGQGYTAYPVGAGSAATDDFAGKDGIPGSLRLDSPSGSDKVQVFTNVTGKPTDLSALSYDTFRQASSTGSDVQTTGLNLTAFCNAAGPNTGFASSVSEPVYNFGDGNPASVVEGAWQTWDAYDGGDAIWWTSKYISTTAGGGISSSAGVGFVGGPDDFVTFDTLTARFATACPAAAALQIGFNQGSGNPGLSVNVDQLSFAIADRSETANFGPLTPVTFDQTEFFGSTAAGSTATASYLISSGPAGRRLTTSRSSSASMTSPPPSSPLAPCPLTAARPLPP